MAEPKKPLDVRDIAAKNPNVDPAKVSEALDAIRDLGNMGVHRSEYGLVLPFTRRAPTEGQQKRQPKSR